MLLRFLGGAQEVGRSSILMQDEKNLMLDYGIKLSEKVEYPISMPKVDAMVLSHAHLDHSGFVPALYNNMLIPTFGTIPTQKLSKLLLDDSLKIARKEKMQPKFHKMQITSMMNRYVSIDYHTPTRLGDFEIELYDAGHISGSAITLIERKGAKENKRIVYTGDFKLEGQELHRGAEAVESDVLITESTYAAREHPEREKLIDEFIAEIRQVLDNGGTALVPVFAVGRAQEILHILHRHHLADRACLDGMARSATGIVLKDPEFISDGESLAKAVDETKVIADHDERLGALSEPSIILTTAGMLNGGPVLDYITKLNKQSEILLTGYQVEGTNGRSLLDRKMVTIDGRSVKIDTPTKYYDFSAHAGESDLYEYVKRSSPHKVICVHGDEKNAKLLAENLKLEGFDAVAPQLGESIEMD